MAALYARDNGAHVANLSAGGDYFKKESAQHCGARQITVPKDEAFDTMVTELNALVASTLGDLLASDGTTLFTLAGGECGGTNNVSGIDEGASEDYYGWPTEAFWASAKTRLISVTVASTENTTIELGPLSVLSNFGEPFEIAAPGER